MQTLTPRTLISMVSNLLNWRINSNSLAVTSSLFVYIHEFHNSSFKLLFRVNATVYLEMNYTRIIGQMLSVDEYIVQFICILYS